MEFGGNNIRFSTPLQQQLYDLLCCLHQLGRDLPQILIHLAEMVQPELSQGRLVPVLGKMFEEIPLLLQQSPLQFQKMTTEPPPDLVTLRLLLDLHELQQILQQISYLQLLHLTNNIIPPGPHTMQLEFLQRAQEIFQSWSRDTLAHYHQDLSETPLHLERQRLLQLEPQVPWELLHFLIELLKLPIEELYSFREWISILPKKQLMLIVQLLQMEPSAILEIKRRMDFSMARAEDETPTGTEWPSDAIVTPSSMSPAAIQPSSAPPRVINTSES